MVAKVGVLLSGCGVYDGSEISESVLVLLSLSRRGAEAVCLAPDVPQLHVINHLTGEVEASEQRNVLVESARIARGAIKDLQGVDIDSLDAVILPGGFGAAKNLCDFAVKGSDCAVLPSVEAFLSAVHLAGKPIGIVCISPVIAARVFGAQRPELTIGDDPGTAGAMEEMGSRHYVCSATEFHVDKNLKLVSTPAYMNASSIAEAEEGIDGMVAAVLDMVSSSRE